MVAGDAAEGRWALLLFKSKLNPLLTLPISRKKNGYLSFPLVEIASTSQQPNANTEYKTGASATAVSRR
jgi:hypothetical protein